MRSQGKPLFPHSPPGNCCKIPSRLMANAQSMLRAQAGAAANETLDATAARAGEGLGSWGEGCQAPAPAGFSLAPSEPVSAGLQHLGRGAQSPGEARPLPQHSRRKRLGERERRGPARAPHPPEASPGLLTARTLEGKWSHPPSRQMKEPHCA
uniref:Uncharacterized protein n=1 Tax=Sus scrofa TaxID=9823 RepID=A0A4X1VGK7_PIG